MYSDISPIDWAWIAGLLEGEGHFNISNTFCRIQLSMTDEDVVAKYAKLLGINVRTQDMSKYNPKAKISFRADVTHRKKVAAVLTAIFPFMSARRKETIKEMVEIYKAKNYGFPLPDVNAT